MIKQILGVVAGLVAWFATASVCAFVLRETWPAYASVVETLDFARETAAPAFTLPMLLARLSMGAVATIVMGFVAARMTSSTLVRLLPGVLLLCFFVVEHLAVWDKFPLWYHLTFLLSLLPLTYLGNLIGTGKRI